MKLQLTLTLLLLLAVVGLTGCYTQLGYHASADFEGRYAKVLEQEKMERTSKTKSEESELEEHGSDDRDSEGYYGRRKPTYRKRRDVSPYRSDSYWGPYAPSWYYAYPPVFYYPHPWFSRYYRPYYGYYRSLLSVLWILSRLLSLYKCLQALSRQHLLYPALAAHLRQRQLAQRKPALTKFT